MPRYEFVLPTFKSIQFQGLLITTRNRCQDFMLKNENSRTVLISHDIKAVRLKIFSVLLFAYRVRSIPYRLAFATLFFFGSTFMAMTAQTIPTITNTMEAVWIALSMPSKLLKNPDPYSSR